MGRVNNAYIDSEVALRKESVDRNKPAQPFIRITRHVALRKESVDRNREYPLQDGGRIGRSPQGERG